MRIIGLDLGTTTLGIAITDGLLLCAHGYENYKFERGNFKKAREHLIEILKKENIKEVCIGLPLYPSGDESPRSLSTRRFVDDLLEEYSEIDVVFVDERYSTCLAEERLNFLNVKPKKKKQVIDKMAACVILETYLEKRGK